jgi:hypothetical protein
VPFAFIFLGLEAKDMARTGGNLREKIQSGLHSFTPLGKTRKEKPEQPNMKLRSANE